MTYTSINFLVFVAAMVLIYFIFPVKKFRWTVLLGANVVFYAIVGYQTSAYIIFTTLSTYLIALWLEKYSAKKSALLKSKKAEWSREEKKKFKDRVKVRKRLIMSLALVLNFGVLAFLKLWPGPLTDLHNMLAGSLNDVLGALRIDFSFPTMTLIEVVGISYYTFQAMGYIVDVYREKVPAQHNPLKLLLFTSFFPQIAQGPISTYDQLAPQLFEGHSFDFTRFKYGCELMLWGFFKKLVIADRAGIAFAAITGENAAQYGSYNGTTLTFFVLLWALRLYADFSGGIDIIRGVAQILGIDMIENFKRPYFSRSISEYWRRWHISLGAWMKNYIFYPIAMSNAFLTISKKMKGTRFGKTAAGTHISKVLPTSVASLIVFLLVGIWHGAEWKFVAFGVWNGGIIMLGILMQPLFDKLTDKLHINRESFLFRLFQILRTFLIVLVGYVFDIAPNFSEGMRTIGMFFTGQNFSEGFAQISGFGLSWKDFVILGVCTVILFVFSVIQEKYEPQGANIRVLLDRRAFVLRWALLFIGVVVVIVFGIYGSGYSAADFVYGGF